MKQFMPFTTTLLLGLLALKAQATLFSGAMQLQDPVAGMLELAPLPVSSPAGLSLRFGLASSFEVRNDHLSFSLWNRYAGDSLDTAAKQALLDDLGGQLASTAEARLPLLEVSWSDSSGHGAAVQVAMEGQGAQRLDLSLLDSFFMGNDPTQPLVVSQADMGAEALLRFRMAWSAPLPWTAGGFLKKPSYGVGLLLEKGQGWTRTHSFNGQVEPLVGELEAHFTHVQDRSGSGSGHALDLALQEERPLAGAPLRVQAALRGLFHRQTWKDVERTERSFILPSTPIGSTFDFEAFTVDVQDTSLTRHVGDLGRTLEAGWMLAADWSKGRWRHSLLAEEAPEDMRGAGRKRLSAASTWRPFGGAFLLGAQLAGGFGRGPALGALGGWQGDHLSLALGATSFAGLGNASRGVRLAVDCRWILH